MEIKLSEAEVKYNVNEYLQTAMNQGKLTYLRLNSGVAFMPSGKGKLYKIQLCPIGTADYFVLQRGQVHLEFKGKREGPVIPIALVTFVELKKTEGKQSPEQIVFEKMITSFNCKYVIVRSVDDLMEALEVE